MRKLGRGVSRVNWQYWFVSIATLFAAIELAAVDRAVPHLVAWVDSSMVVAPRLSHALFWACVAVGSLPWAFANTVLTRTALILDGVSLLVLLGTLAGVGLLRNVYALPIIYGGLGLALGAVLVRSWQVMVEKSFGKQRRLLFALTIALAMAGQSVYHLLVAALPGDAMAAFATPAMVDVTVAAITHGLIVLLFAFLPSKPVRETQQLVYEQASDVVTPRTTTLTNRVLRFSLMLALFVPLMSVSHVLALFPPASQEGVGVVAAVVHEIPPLAGVLLIPFLHILLYRLAPFRPMVIGAVAAVGAHYLYLVVDDATAVGPIIGGYVARSLAHVGYGIVAPLLLYYTVTLSSGKQPAPYASLGLMAYAVASLVPAFGLPAPLWAVSPSVGLATPVLLVLLYRVALDPDMRAHWRRRPPPLGSGFPSRRYHDDDDDDDDDAGHGKRALSSLVSPRRGQLVHRSSTSNLGGHRGVSADDLVSLEMTSIDDASSLGSDDGNPFDRVAQQLRENKRAHERPRSTSTLHYRALALEVKSRRKTMGTTPTRGGGLRQRIISVTTVKKSVPIPIPLTKEVVASASSCSSVCSADTSSPILDPVTGLDWTREVRKVRHTLGVCCHRHRKRSV